MSSKVNAMLKSILVTTANGKPQTASSRLPFAVNAMLKVSIKASERTSRAWDSLVRIIESNVVEEGIR